MRIFKISKDLEIVCEWKKTRTAFKHVATLLKNGNEIGNTKICYLNRTWERFEFQSILEKIIDMYFKGEEKEKFLEVVKDDKEEGGFLKTVAMVSALGNIVGNTQKEKNDWKKRMLSTVNGLSFPDDFDSLPEEERTKRLDGALKQIEKG